MKKIFGIDLGTTYSCIAYIDEDNKPVVLKNSEGELTTPSVVHFETPKDVHVGSIAKESAELYPNQVVSFIKRHMGEEDYSLNINDVDYKPEDISSYILKKLVNDAKDELSMEGKLDDGEDIKDVVITCPAYFGIAERKATETAGKIAGLNVLSIINEPTAAAIDYGVTEAEQEKNVLVYDLGGGTFDVTVINIKPGQIKVICTGGDKNLGGKDWDDRILMYLQEQYQAQTGSDDEILSDPETLQQLSVQAERAKKLLSAKPKAPVPVNYDGNHARVVLTRDDFEAKTKDLLDRTVDYTKDIFKEAEKKGVKQSDISEILLVGGSSKMPQVRTRLKQEFGMDIKMFDPDEAVAKGAAIYANNMQKYNDMIQKIADATGKDADEVKENIDSGKSDIAEEAKKANITTTPDESHLMLGGAQKIVNVSSRSFGMVTYIDANTQKIANIILKNDELPANNTQTFYPMQDNQQTVLLQVYESLSSDEQIDMDMGKEVGKAELTLAPNTPHTTEIKVTFKLDNEGLLSVHAEEAMTGKKIDATFQTKNAMSQDEVSNAIRRSNDSSVD